MVIYISLTYLIPLALLFVLNIISSVILFRRVKIVNHLNEVLCRRRLFVRFSIANVMASLFYSVIIISNFVILLLSSISFKYENENLTFYSPFLHGCLTICSRVGCRPPI